MQTRYVWDGFSQAPEIALGLVPVHLTKLNHVNSLIGTVVTQAKLQHLKQQYQQKQLQLQQQRQQLLSQAAASNHSVAADGQSDPDGAESSKRQPIPLHIALQNHLHAHHVTEGNVNDLAQALQDWDTRDRNINLPQSQVKVCSLALYELRIDQL